MYTFSWNVNMFCIFLPEKKTSMLLEKLWKYFLGKDERYLNGIIESWHQWITHIVWKEKYSEMSVSGRKIEESMIKGEKKHDDATYV